MELSSHPYLFGIANVKSDVIEIEEFSRGWLFSFISVVSLDGRLPVSECTTKLGPGRLPAL